MFDKFATKVARASASPHAFALATLSIVFWAGTGPYFGYSDLWQMTVNTGTTIVTFLLAFIILASNARSEAALQVKLDELLRATQGARNDLIAAEERSSAEIKAEAAALRASAKAG